ncbi:MAG TPA: acetyl-CoA synthetase, partial [Clostridiales bacterium]|nr:acetyl-CoA synthetase [Clostridiales bacterium]
MERIMKINNIAYTCLTHYCEQGLGDKEILCWIEKDLTERTFTYNDFETESNKIANILKILQVKNEDVVSIFLPRSLLLISSFFGILKRQAISCILFSTLGEDALLDRLGNSQAKIVITKNSLVRKILANKEDLPKLEAILVVDVNEHKNNFVLSLNKLMGDVSTNHDYTHQLNAETPAFLQYTSGSTGKPKGAMHVHGAIQDIIQS